MIRRILLDEVFELLDEFPAVALLGARHVGKTTLAPINFGFEVAFLKACWQKQGVIACAGGEILSEAILT